MSRPPLVVSGRRSLLAFCCAILVRIPRQTREPFIKYTSEDTRKESNPSRLLGDELEEYMIYLRSPWRIIWKNFLAGIFRGLGALLGASVVLATLLWLLTLTQSFPLIGQYMSSFHSQILGFIEEARYSDDFQRVEILLEGISRQLGVQPVDLPVENAPDVEQDSN